MTGEYILKLREQLKTTRQPLETHWDELAHYFMPFRLSGGELPNIPSAESLSDSTGRECALVMANGLASLVIPREEIWFEWMPPQMLEKDDEAVAFYRKASTTGRELIERSNFYEEAQEFLIASPVFGTAALFIGDMDASGLYFRAQSPATYYIAEDAQGRVNCVLRELSLTPDQAAKEFGEDKLPQAIANKVGKPLGMTEKTIYVHAVMARREAAAADAPEGERKAFESQVVEETSKKLVQSGGYDEFPFAVHRYRRFGRIPWGFGPGTTGLSNARQLEFLERLTDAAAEKAVFPPVQAPASLEGEIGQGALEITYLDPSNPNEAGMLKEWASIGRYDYAKDRLNDKREQLRRVFHNDLFNLFSARAMERAPMTATEAQLVAGEKLTQFSPVFGRLVSEFLTPVLLRVFAIGLRAGAFGQPPPSVFTEKGIPAPGVRFKNRIMLAMQSRTNQNLMDFVNLASPILQFDPSAIDAINVPNTMRDTARNAGLPESWIRPAKEVAALQAARAEAAQAQQEAVMAQSVASAGKDLGGMPADMRQNMAQQLKGAES
jgi:hypothetical protein